MYVPRRQKRSKSVTNAQQRTNIQVSVRALYKRKSYGEKYIALLL